MTYKTDKALYPWLILEEELNSRNMKQGEVAERLWISLKHLNNLIHWKVSLSQELALGLEKVFSIPASFWNKYESWYQEEKARIAQEIQMHDEIEQTKAFTCYNKLAKRWFVEKTRNWNHKYNNLLAFFQVSSFRVMENISSGIKQSFSIWENIAFRKSEYAKLSNFNLACWIKVWEKKADQQYFELPEYSNSNIKELIKHLKIMTQKTDTIDVQMIQKYLNTAWILFAAIPHFEKVPVNWIARFYRKKPMIQMSFRQWSIDSFWFTLFHEIGHIVLWHLKKNVYIIDSDVSDNDAREIEEEANVFARNVLVEHELYQNRIIKPENINEKDVTQVAHIAWVWVNIVAWFVTHDLRNSQKEVYRLTSPLRPSIPKSIQVYS